MCNAEGGQAFGNRMEIRPLTEEAFQRYVRPRLRAGFAATLAEYRAVLPQETYFAMVWRAGDNDWQFAGSGSLQELESQARESPWALEARSFASPEALSFGHAADSDIETKTDVRQ